MGKMHFNLVLRSQNFTSRVRKEATPFTSFAAGNRAHSPVSHQCTGKCETQWLQELRLATGCALHTTKGAVQALGKTMSTFVVQQHNLWLNLGEMKNPEKV